jgi:CRP-like cAMP-binding protein
MGCNGSKGNDTTNDKGKEPAQGDREKDRRQAKEDNKHYADTMKFLAQVNLLKRLPKDQHPLLANACIPTEFKAGATVIKQGESGSEFFVIKNGEASVNVSIDNAPPKQVAALKAYDYFGENALLRDEPRTATITAVTTLQTYRITREKFQELGLHEQLLFAHRKAVGCGGGQKGVVAKPPTSKSDEEKTNIEEALRSNANLQTMVNLDKTRVKQLIDVAWKETFTAGSVVIEEGDLVADYFYIVQEGQFEIFVSEPGEQVDENNTASSMEAIMRTESRQVGYV